MGKCSTSSVSSALNARIRSGELQVSLGVYIHIYSQSTPGVAWIVQQHTNLSELKERGVRQY